MAAAERNKDCTQMIHVTIDYSLQHFTIQRASNSKLHGDDSFQPKYTKGWLLCIAEPHDHPDEHILSWCTSLIYLGAVGVDHLPAPAAARLPDCRISCALASCAVRS